MSQLNDNLVEIKRQKDTYLLPENLRKNINLLGVEGAYEGNLTDAEYQEANDDLDDILENTTPFYITNAESLFANNARLNQMTELLGMCKNVTIMTRMFASCTNLTSLDLTNLIDTSELLQADNMFANCSNLTSLNLSTFKPTKIKNTSNMFGNCLKLISIDVSNWDASHITNMGTMFANCPLLESIDFTGWTLSAMVSNFSSTFASCPALNNDTLNSIMGILGTAHPTYNKTLKYLGLSSTQATACTSLSNWSVLSAAGWTTGY